MSTVESSLLSTAMQWAGACFLLVGALFTLIAAIGVVRMPYSFQRMHAASKPQLLGLACICVGIALELQQWKWTVLVIVVLILQVITAPVSSHLVSRALYQTGSGDKDPLVVDELAEDRSSSSTID